MDPRKDTTQKKFRVAIVGAGASGLTAAKAAYEEDLEPTIFELSKNIGGVWGPDGQAWNGMSTNTSGRLMNFSDFPIDPSLPNFLTRPHIEDYLNRYDNEFNIRPCIKFECKVKSTEYTKDGWRVCWEENNQEQEEYFDGFIAASGKFTKAALPQIKGLDQFKGEKFHSSELKSVDDLIDKTFLVIGNAFSGITNVEDIANKNINRKNIETIHAVRTKRWHMRRHIRITTENDDFNLPYDHLRTRESHKIPTPQEHYNKFAKLCPEQNDIAQLKLPPDKQYRPSFEENYLDLVKNGNIIVCDEPISHFDENGVVFKNGKRYIIDGVLFSTGYEPRIPYLDKMTEMMLLKEELWCECIHPELPNCGVIGMYDPNRDAVFPYVELQARLICRLLAKKILQVCMNDLRNKIKLPENKMPLDAMLARDFIAKQIGVYPNFGVIKEQDPELYRLLMEGTLSPAQYRLNGPGANYEKAKEAIKELASYQEKLLPQGATISTAIFSLYKPVKLVSPSLVETQELRFT